MGDQALLLARLRRFFADNYAGAGGWRGALAAADLTCVHAGASIVVRASCGSADLALRLDDPARRHRSFTLKKQHELFMRLFAANPGLRRFFPEVLHFEPRVPCLIEEFVPASVRLVQTLDDLRQPIQVIRELNATPVTPGLYSLLRARSDEHGLGWYFPKWAYRLARSYVSLHRDSGAALQVARAAAVAAAAHRALRRRPLDYPRALTLHFDGAHVGNFLCRADGSSAIVDLDKASLRQDPTFTLAHFLASFVCSDPKVDTRSVLPFGVSAYLDGREDAVFSRMAQHRFVERLVSNLVWMLWDRAVARRALPDDAVVRQRCAFVRAMLPEV